MYVLTRTERMGPADLETLSWDRSPAICPSASRTLCLALTSPLDNHVENMMSWARSSSFTKCSLVTDGSDTFSTFVRYSSRASLNRDRASA